MGNGFGIQLADVAIESLAQARRIALVQADGSLAQRFYGDVDAAARF
jgi:hypothetical protein